MPDQVLKRLHGDISARQRSMVVLVHGRTGQGDVVRRIVRVRVEVRRGGDLREGLVAWCLLNRLLREGLRREVLVGRFTRILVVHAHEVAISTFHDNLTQIWAQVLDALEDLAEEAAHKDVDRLLAGLLLECDLAGLFKVLLADLF